MKSEKGRLEEKQNKGELSYIQGGDCLFIYDMCRKVCVYIYIYIYIFGTFTVRPKYLSLSLSLYIYIYIYTYIYVCTYID